MSRKKSLKNLSRFSHYTGYSMWSLCQSYISQVPSTLKRSCSEQPLRQKMGWSLADLLVHQVILIYFKGYNNLVYNYFFFKTISNALSPKKLKTRYVTIIVYCPHLLALVAIFQPFLTIFFTTAYLYLSQNWHSDHHFEVLKS